MRQYDSTPHMFWWEPRLIFIDYVNVFDAAEAKFVNSIKCLGGVVVTLVKDRIQLQKVNI